MRTAAVYGKDNKPQRNRFHLPSLFTIMKLGIVLKNHLTINTPKFDNFRVNLKPNRTAMRFVSENKLQNLKFRQVVKHMTASQRRDRKITIPLKKREM